jgi:hypothetical protein
MLRTEQPVCSRLFDISRVEAKRQITATTHAESWGQTTSHEDQTNHGSTI